MFLTKIYAWAGSFLPKAEADNVIFCYHDRGSWKACQTLSNQSNPSISWSISATTNGIDWRIILFQCFLSQHIFPPINVLRLWVEWHLHILLCRVVRICRIREVNREAVLLALCSGTFTSKVIIFRWSGIALNWFRLASYFLEPLAKWNCTLRCVSW